MKPLHELLSVRLAGWAVSGAVAHATLGGISTIILARALDPSALGAYGIFLAIVILLGQLGDLGLGTAFVRLATPVFQRREDARELYGSFLALRLLAVAALGALGLVITGLLDTGWQLVAAGALGGMLLTIANHHHEVLRAQLRHRYTAVIRTAMAGTRAVTYGSLALAGMLDVMVAIGVGLATLALEDLVTMLRAAYRGAVWPPRIRPRRDWFVISGWLFLISGSGAVITHTDTLLLSWLGGPVETGWWVAASRLIGPLPLVIGALWSVVLPVSVALDQRQKLERFLGLAWRTSLGLALLAALGTLLVGPAVALLFGSEYLGAAAAGRWLLVAHGVNAGAILFGGLVLRLRLERELALVTLAQLAINTVGDVLLIPHYGAAGCAAVTALVMTVGSVWSVTRVQRARKVLLA